MRARIRRLLPIAVATLAAVPFPLASAADLNMVKVHVDGFAVVGVQARTSNAAESAGHGSIEKLWAQLMLNHFDSQIRHRVDSRIVAVYSDYESDKNGPYTFLLGAKVSSVKDLSPGMSSRQIAAGSYAMFTAEGEQPGPMVLDLWERIWSLEKSNELHRAYKTDYELHYTVPGEPPAKSHVDIYIGLRTDPR